MTLRELVMDFRKEHGISQRQFANMCGLSNGYISMLERNSNPKTGLPVTPSLTALKKIAQGMGMTLNDLFLQADDMPVDLLQEESEKNELIPGAGDEHEIEAMQLFESLSEAQRLEALNYLRYLATNGDKQ